MSVTGKTLRELSIRKVRLKKVQGGLMNQNSGPASLTPKPKMIRQKRTPLENFHRHVEIDVLSGCWIWTGATFSPKGRVMPMYKSADARRFSFRNYKSDDPKDHMRADNTCSTNGCVNPEHIRFIKQDMNIVGGAHCHAGSESKFKTMFGIIGGNRFIPRLDMTIFDEYA